MTASGDVAAQTQSYLPLITAIVGGIIGGIFAILAQLVVHWVKERPRRALEDKQKDYLKALLTPENMPMKKGKTERVEWRKFETLRDVIGADDETARRLLIEIGARRAANQQNVWALEKNKPLNPKTPIEDVEGI